MPNASNPIAELTEKDKERFWKRVEKRGPDECWLWRGLLTRGGYGSIRIGRKMVTTHRVSYFISFGQITNGLHALHKCDVRNCVNPAHIFLGTNLENMIDREAKGRNKPQRGDKNGARLYPERLMRGDGHWARTNPEKVKRGIHQYAAKLSDEKVREARARHAAGGVTFTDLGKEYGVSNVAITNAIRGKTWASIPLLAPVSELG